MTVRNSSLTWHFSKKSLMLSWMEEYDIPTLHCDSSTWPEIITVICLHIYMYKQHIESIMINLYTSPALQIHLNGLFEHSSLFFFFLLEMSLGEWKGEKSSNIPWMLGQYLKHWLYEIKLQNVHCATTEEQLC